MDFDITIELDLADANDFMVLIVINELLDRKYVHLIYLYIFIGVFVSDARFNIHSMYILYIVYYASIINQSIYMYLKSTDL